MCSCRGEAAEADQQLVTGDCLTVLAGLPADSVDVVVTSPPGNGEEQLSGLDLDPEYG